MVEGPLSGVRIIEMAAIGPVPLAGMILSGLGADIVRVGNPKSKAQLDPAGAVLNRGKRQIDLDLKVAAPRDALLDLVASADAIIDGARPGVMERLGLGPEDCSARNPRLVYARVTGWGQDGPLAHSAGHDLNYLAMTGMLHAIGDADAPPTVPLNLIADYGGGTMFAALGIVAALFSARATGKGDVIDVAMIDGVANLSAMFQGFISAGVWRDERHCNLLDGGRPFYRCYTCSDGKHVSVGALEPQFFTLLVSMLDLSDKAFQQHDPAHWAAMEQAFAEAFSKRTRDEWAALFLGTDACVAPVLSMTEALHHPANAARRVFVDHEGIMQAAPAPRFERSSTAIGTMRNETVADVLNAWAD